ncbi:MAG: DUF979 domain-containing protein [Treponema sp.]|nr:DUF979 domain-containing protein [Treponema sp.]
MFIVEWFLNPSVPASQKGLEVMYLFMGFVCLYCALRNLRDRKNSSPVGTAVFWGTLGVVLAAGRWLPNAVSGILVVVMTLPAILRRVKPGSNDVPSAEYTAEQAKRIGMKIFVPAFSIGTFAIFFAIFLPRFGALVGLGVGVAVSGLTLALFNRENRPKIFLADSKRFLDTIGPLCMLPMLLASLGAVFTAAGVGDTIASLVRPIIPDGNVTVGIIVYCLGMVLFTMIMGNAFAAITVMTVGVGAPFVLAHGANPAVVGMLALTTGYCGTLMTPMAANFNVVPVAILEMRGKYTVIRNQLAVALPVMVFQIILMILFS